MKKIFIKTYGCTLNRSDSDLIEGMLVGKGYLQANSEEEADAVIVNTCAVKETTENKILWHLKELERKGKPTIVAGCLPPVSINAVKRAIPSALGILGPNSIGRIPELLEDKFSQSSKNNGDGRLAIIGPPTSTPEALIDLKSDFSTKFPLTKLYGSVIARIQTSSGCLSNCTFCATKIARGGFKSKPPSLILNEARMAIKNHAKEIQLASQDNGCYGFDLRTDMPELLVQLSDLEGRFRIRVGMANPQHFLKSLDEWVEAFRLAKVYKFLHLPFQSGSEKVLLDMRRGHTVEDAVFVVQEFKRKIPSLTLATDMIVGFPGETPEEFGQSLEICRKLKFDVVNFAKYSKRRGTKAAKMRQFHSRILKERAEIMNKVVKEIALEQNLQYVGATYPDVLITEKARNGYFQGRNINYKAVLLKGDGLEVGQFADVKIAGASVTSLIAG
ncbi:MAG: tRNA (N(6)-L-threonylcarbamoyladenosine(37)-C(2))-methylthiotransferase [Candidatus Micrarchaeota archaeon]